MKYSEFREYLKSNDFEVIENDEMIKVIIDTFKCIIVSKKAPEEIVLPYFIGKTKDFKLLEKALELAETPLNEREEEKKYYLKHRFINKYSTRRYVNFTTINFVTTEEVILSDLCEEQHYQTKFTKAQIEELKEKFDTDFNDFELIEVEED